MKEEWISFNKPLRSLTEMAPASLVSQILKVSIELTDTLM